MEASITTIHLTMRFKLIIYTILLLLFLTPCFSQRERPNPPPPDPPDDPPTTIDLPLCEVHDPTIYHGLVSADGTCHYTHTHGVDPSSTIFASRVAAWGSLFDGELHQGYKFLYDEGPANFDGFGDGIVLAALVRHHSVGTVQHMSVRYHTTRAELLVCDPTLAQCGFVSIKQLTDYGVTHCSYKEEQCPLPDDPWGDLSQDGLNLSGEEDQPPYKAKHKLNQKNRILKKGINDEFWQSLGPNASMFNYFSPISNVLFGTSWRVIDSFGLITDQDDFEFAPRDENFLGGAFNASAMCTFNIRLMLPSELPRPFSGYTDNNGNLNTNCSTEGSGCNPFIVDENVPVGIDVFNFSRSVSNDCSTSIIQEFDLCDLNGQLVSCSQGGTSVGWIEP